MCGDDSAGPRLVRKLDASGEVMSLDVGTVPESFVGRMAEAGADVILLVDAVDFGGQPGSVALFEPDQISRGWCTTHRVPLGILMKFIEQETGSDVLLLGIQPKTVYQNAPLSQEVEASVEALAELMNRHMSDAVEKLRAGLRPIRKRDRG